MVSNTLLRVQYESSIRPFSASIIFQTNICIQSRRYVPSTIVSYACVFLYSSKGALPFSKYLYYVNTSLSVPTRCVWFSVIIGILLGTIALAGNTASSAIFALAVVGQYSCYTTAIVARWMGGSEFEKGPFHMGILVS